MTRTIEIILVVIGSIIHSFFMVIGGFMAWMYHNEDKVTEMLEDIDLEEDEELSPNEFIELINEIGGSGWYIAIGAAVAIITGIVALFFLRRNKNAKVAGYILISSALITTIGSLGGTVIGGIVFFIAGLMCLLRKPKHQVTEVEEH